MSARGCIAKRGGRLPRSAATPSLSRARLICSERATGLASPIPPSDLTSTAILHRRPRGSQGVQRCSRCAANVVVGRRPSGRVIALLLVQVRRRRRPRPCRSHQSAGAYARHALLEHRASAGSLPRCAIAGNIASCPRSRTGGLPESPGILLRLATRSGPMGRLILADRSQVCQGAAATRSSNSTAIGTSRDSAGQGFFSSSGEMRIPEDDATVFSHGR
jgi:hypothetical protein